MSASRSPSDVCDVVLVGGGLANSLIALALRRRRPELSLRVLEAAPALRADHTWSLFRSDVTSHAWSELSAAFEQSWPSYEVAFPGGRRTLATPYASLTSERLGRLVSTALGPDLHQGRRAAVVHGDGVVCEDGAELRARVVIDGRGAAPSRHLSVAFQKFLGLELRLAEPHGLTRPMVMDASVAQEDGFRFLYVLPLAPDRVLVEDTRYSDAPPLDVGRLAATVADYVAARGWRVVELIRRETGVLPVALDGDASAYFAEPGRETPQVGLRGLFFHPTTGYSLPDAVRVADLVADDPLTSSTALARKLAGRSQELWRERGFYRALNRMLFFAAEPEARYKVFERFYRLPHPLIERFYAARSTWADKLRILTGKPPVPIGRALSALPPRALHA